MRAHHFDAVTMCPLGGGLVSGGPLFEAAELVCHCLLVESAVGLVLVDTGLFASVQFRRYDAGGDSWKGFDAVRPLDGEPDVAVSRWPVTLEVTWESRCAIRRAGSFTQATPTSTPAK